MLLKAEGITKRFSGQATPVLDAASIEVREGELVGIVGPSGGGKTTLARIIARLEPADSGTVEFNGASVSFGGGSDVRNSRKEEVRRAWMDMQMVFQNPKASFSEHMDIGAAVWEGAAYKPDFLHFGKEQRLERVEWALESVGLGRSFADKRSFEISGGECQRAAIARAIIGSPKLVICDEATSSLDVTVQARIIELLRRLNGSQGVAILFISHNLAVVQNLCERVYAL